MQSCSALKDVPCLVVVILTVARHLIITMVKALRVSDMMKTAVVVLHLQTRDFTTRDSQPLEHQELTIDRMSMIIGMIGKVIAGIAETEVRLRLAVDIEAIPINLILDSEDVAPAEEVATSTPALVQRLWNPELPETEPSRIPRALSEAGKAVKDNAHIGKLSEGAV
jgi:hypothetical protein